MNSFRIMGGFIRRDVRRPQDACCCDDEGSGGGGPTVCIDVEISSGAIPGTGQVDEAYSFQLTANGSAPITWAVTAGALPPGILLDGATGVLSGSPSAADTYNFTITASNLCPSTDTVDGEIVVSEVTPPGTAMRYWFEWDDIVPGTFTANQVLVQANNGNTAGAGARSSPWLSSIVGGESHFDFPEVLTGMYRGFAVPTGTVSNVTLQGFPFLLNPANNTRYQQITLNGQLSDLYISQNPIAGAMTEANLNPVIATVI